MSHHLQRKALLAALTMACGLAAAAPSNQLLSSRAVASPAPEAAAAANDGTLLLLQAGIFDPTRERLQMNGLNLRQTASSPFVVVQYHGNRVPSADQLRARGFEVLGYLPHNAFQLKLSGEQRADLASDSAVRYVGDWQPAYKIAPQLQPGSDVRAPGAVHLVDVYGHYGESQIDFDARVNAVSAGIPRVRGEQRMGRPFVRLQVNNGSLDSVLASLANEQQVSWIERFELPQLLNANSVGPIQNNVASGGNPTAVASIWAKGILGTGQIVAVTDSGLDRNEGWFNRLNKGAGVLNGITDAEATTPPVPGTLFPNNKVIGYWVMPGASAYDDNQVCSTSPTSFHGTHVSGTVAGDSGTASTPTTPNYNTGDGMAPNAQILFQDGGNDSTGCLSGLAAQLRPMWEQAQAGGAYISNNSYGSGFSGAYVAGDADLDETAWLNEQFMVVVSAGNAGTAGIGHPSHAKHSMSVGALGNGLSTTTASFSSRGPTADGRRKPDIQAPGSNIVSAAGNDIDTNPPASPDQANSKPLSGTSMSGPTVAGGAALARQYFEDGFYPSGARLAADGRKPLGAELKALLLNGTAFIGTGASIDTITPGNRLGWGRIFLDNNLFFTGDTRDVRTWALTKENGLRNGENHEYQVQVNAGAEFRATLVWYDPPGTLGAARALVNNLDLEVVTPGGTLLGNNFPTTGANTQTNAGGTADAVNTVEQVKINAPTAGTYTIRVKGTAVPGNQYYYSSRQGYALVTSQATVATAVSSAPTAPTLNNSGGNVVVTSGAVAGASSYQIYRATGTCASAASTDFQFVGKSATTSFVDTGTQGGFSYAYKVRGADLGGEGPISECSDVLSTAACTLFPAFNAQSLTASAIPGSTCGVELNWSAATAACPTATNVRYNLYRSTNPFFTPDSSNRIASSLSATTFTDPEMLSLTTYYYAVRAEDDTTGNAGPNGGNETPDTVRRNFTATGAGQVAGTFFDGADSPSLLSVEPQWSITNSRVATGQLSYRNAPHGNATYGADACYSVTTPPITLQAGSPVLSYKARFNVEVNWDGVVNEISTDGGNTWNDLAPDGGYPTTLSATQGNGCDFPSTRGVYSGTSGGVFQNKTRSLSSFAGQTVQLRWRFTSDGSAEEEGFYLDDVQVTNASTPAACTSTALLKDGFED